MPVRHAHAVWNGTLREGNGTMAFGSGAFEGNYNFGSRFEESPGTNPEELIGAAHAGCFSMALSGQLVNAGYPPDSISTDAKVYIEKGDAGFKITRIELTTEGKVPGISADEFQEKAEAAKQGCPVSQALAGVDISLNAKLVS